MTFECYHSDSDEQKKQSWICEVKQFIKTDTGFEAEITGRGSRLYIIVSNYQYGKYICIPGLQVSSELASLDDCFWNSEQLSMAISIIDAITVANALRGISKHLKTAAG